MLTTVSRPSTPWPLMREWVTQAREAAAAGAVHEPDAMAVATVDASGVPDVRMVLMRFFDPRGVGDSQLELPRLLGEAQKEVRVQLLDGGELQTELGLET